MLISRARTHAPPPYATAARARLHIRPRCPPLCACCSPRSRTEINHALPSLPHQKGEDSGTGDGAHPPPPPRLSRPASSASASPPHVSPLIAAPPPSVVPGHWPSSSSPATLVRREEEPQLVDPGAAASVPPSRTSRVLRCPAPGKASFG
ncbi:hypothetical protein SORBI_3003G065201 [Sorghum bicolor]|uniref:Uncharacterized protein n=1 Tax=Sorghum bicolor TaxID=4558 RepID=A0A1B6Q1U3_SORBI|nr:hypothetical protein SORBI_3003G065201 [Sorghum bicolor]